jgi:hypothetical protein
MNTDAKMTPDEARAHMIATFREQIAELEADTRTDFILAWPTLGLAVKFHQDIPGPQLHVCHIGIASPIDRHAHIDRITNGHGDEAIRVRRDDAGREQIAHLRGLIAQLKTEA